MTASAATLTVELRNASKRFGKIQALDEANLAVREGECLVIAGPSGAGKTTLLRLVAGLEKPDSGDVVIEGRTVNKDGAWVRRTGMTFENYALYPHLTVRDNIAFPLRSKAARNSANGKESEESRVRRIAEMLRIEELLDRQTDQLSGGQRQRVSLARCLVREAVVFLLDEPLAHLDAKLRLAMRTEFKRMVSKLNATMIYATHDYREAMALGDRIAVIQEGQIIQVDTPKRIFDQPASLLVARFAGHPPINTIEGSIEGGLVRLSDAGEGAVLGAYSAADDVNFSHGPVIIGVRPMDCTWDGGAGSGLEGIVRAVKVRQDNTGTVLAETGSGLVEATLATSARPQFGDRIDIRIEEDRSLIFDKESERLLGRIVPGASKGAH